MFQQHSFFCSCTCVKVLFTDTFLKCWFCWKVEMISAFPLRTSLSLAMFWNSEKLSNFKAHKLSWTVNELCTRILRVPSSCPPIAHIHRWALRKNHPFAVFSFKMQHMWHEKKHTHKQQDNRDLKYQVIISNYNFIYAVISKFTFFKDVIITIIYKT